MWKAALAGALALAMVGLFSPLGVTPAAAEDVVVTEAQIAQLKAALKLTPAQERNWAPVAATLRSLARHQQQYQVASADAGFVERAHARVSGYAMTAMAMQRLRTAAARLIGVLSDEQKSAGQNALHSMGVSF